MQAFGSMGNLLGMMGLNIGKDDRDKISHEGEKQFKKMEVFIIVPHLHIKVNI